MAKYLILGSYNSTAWATQVKEPGNRIDAVRPMFERMGGSLESAYFAFGDYDIVGIVDMPNNITAAAMSIAVSAGGALRTFKTVPLIDEEEGVEALKKAAQMGYAPPGS